MYWLVVAWYGSPETGFTVNEITYSVPPGALVLPVEVIESMWAGVSTPTLVSRWALFASAIWSADAPTPTLLVAACADSAAFFILSMKPITASLPFRLLPALAPPPPPAGPPQPIDR